MNKRGVIELVLLGIFLALALVWVRSALSEGLAKENRLTAKRLERAFVPMLLKAHRQKDDLAIQEAVTALAQAPGIGFACVLDSSEKAVAHSRLDQLGKKFAHPRESTRIINIVLKDESTRWGTFLFSMSTRSTESLHQKMTGIALFGWGLLMAGFAFRLYWESRRLHRLENQSIEEKTLRLETEEQVKRLEHRLKTQQEDTQILVTCSLNHLDKPVILFDKYQRVAAINPAAQQALGIVPGRNLLGESWQDVPILQDQGAEMEKSIGQPILFELQNADALTPKPVLRVCR